MKYLLLAMAVLVLGGVLWVRFSRDDAARWHVDPVGAVLSGKPNQYLLKPADAPVFETDAAALAQAFDEMALAQPHVIRLAVVQRICG